MDGIDAYLTGKYYGTLPTATEYESGAAVELREQGPLKKNGAGHSVLTVFAHTDRPMTAYEASFWANGDHHSRRREATRLLERGFLIKEGVLPNPAPEGRPHVDAYLITAAGRVEYERLEAEE